MTGGTRGGNGRFTRTADSRNRDYRAAELHGQGWSYQRIADELGFASKGKATTPSMRAFADMPTEEAEHARQRLDLERIDRLIEQAWEVMRTAARRRIQRQGGAPLRRFRAAIRRQRGAWTPTASASPSSRMSSTTARSSPQSTRSGGCSERRAKIFGYDAPAKSRVEVITAGHDRVADRRP